MRFFVCYTHCMTLGPTDRQRRAVLDTLANAGRSDDVGPPQAINLQQEQERTGTGIRSADQRRVAGLSQLRPSSLRETRDGAKACTPVADVHAARKPPTSMKRQPLA